MTEPSSMSDRRVAGDEPEDVAVVSSRAETYDALPHEDVVRSIRYLLYRHELTSGSPHLPQMIAVVSASAGEGVTTMSQALAHVLASERGTRVCWIDVGNTDTPPPSLGRGNLAALPGIATTLHEVQLDQARDDPPAPPIRLVPGEDAPQRHPSRQPSGGAELDDLINGLAAEYRHVIFDTPPLLSRVDSIGFLRHAEAYLLVTKQGSTTLNQARTIAEELRPIPCLGAILNGHRTRTPRFVRRFFRE